MKKQILTTLIVSLAIISAQLPAMAKAAGILNVKHIELSQKGGVAPGLQNVASIMSRCLPYKGCRLIEQQSCVFPANAALSFKDGYKLIFRTLDDGKTAVIILRGKKQLMSMSVILEGTDPVVIGGFTSGFSNSRRIFVLRKSLPAESCPEISED